MDFLTLRKRSNWALGGLLAITVCAGSMQASNTLIINQGSSATAVTSVAVSCNTATGTGATQTIIIKPVTALTGSNTITVTYSQASPTGGIVVTPPSSAVLSTGTTSLTYTVNVAAGCVGASSATKTVQFLAASNSGSAANDVTLGVVDTVTVASSSGLLALPVTLSCTRSGSSSPYTYTPGASQSMSVTSAATGGIPFTVSNPSAPAWLTLGSPSSGTASTTASTISVSTSSPCGSFAPGTSNTATIHLVSTGAGAGPADLLVVVTLLVVSPTPLTVTPVPAAPSISMTYIKGSGNPATANVSVTSSVSGAFFTVNTSTLPIWLTVNSTSGVATAPLAFSTTNTADTLPPGTYTATIVLKVSGYADYSFTITLLVNNKTPKLSVNALSVPVSWTIGSATPTVNITAYSSDSPIAYTITTGGTLAPIVPASELAGLAYSFGAKIPVTFNPLVFATAQPGTVITGTVTFSWGTPASTTVVTISLTVVSPGATLTSISPATLPTAVPGSVFTVTLTGTGFVGGSDATLKTRVGTVSGSGLGVITADTNFSVNVVNPSNIILTVTVPAIADPLLPFAPGGISGVVGGPVYLGLCNGTCTIPTGTATLTIGGGPIVNGVSSSSSFTEVTPPTLPTIAPYDMISLFGSNFCASSGTGCATSTILIAGPDALTLRYPTTLSPDVPPYVLSSPANIRNVSVSFYAHGTSTLIGTAPLLFATNNQINLIVPEAVSGSYVGNATVDIVASFGYGSGATLLKSAPFAVNVAASDPGVFTIGANGQGAGAALNSSYALISSTNPAGMRTGSHTAADSDWIQLYVTGLGLPTSTGSDLSGGNGCIADVVATGVGSYQAVLQSATSVSPSLASIDGAVIQSGLLAAGNLPPCLSAVPTVKIGGVSATVAYAGFVPDTVAGLYQINVQLPASNTTFYPYYPITTSPITPSGGFSLLSPVQLPVQVTVGSISSQSNVTVWVAPRLLVTGPATVSTTGSASSGSTALTVASATNLFVGQSVAGTGIAAGTTVAAISGTAVTLSLVTTGVLSGGAVTFSTSNNTVNTTVGIPYSGTVAAFEGTSAYRYAVTSGVLPSGLTLNANSGVVSGTPNANTAGTYAVTITATDSANIPVTGTYSMIIVVNGGLFVTFTGSSPLTAPAFGAGGTPPVLTAVTATGGTYGVNGYTFAITTPSTVPTGMAVTSPGAHGNVTTTAATPAGVYTVAVTATDSSSTPLTGTANFAISVPLGMSNTTPVTGVSYGTPTALFTVTPAGYSGTPVFTLDATSLANGFTVNSSGIVTNSTVGASGPFSITVTATDSVTMAPGATGFGTASTTPISVTLAP